MKTAKKLVSLLTVMVLAISLCACGSKEESKPAGKPAQGNTGVKENVAETPQDNPSTESDQPDEPAYEISEEEKAQCKAMAKELYDQNQPYLLFYSTYDLPTEDNTGASEFEGINNYMKTLDIKMTPSEIRAASNNDKLLRYQLAVPYDLFHETESEEDYGRKYIWHTLTYSDYNAPYNAIYLKDMEDKMGDEYGTFKRIVDDIYVNGRRVTIIDGYLTYSGDEVPLDDVIIKTKCRITIGVRQKYKEDRCETECFIEQPLAELTTDDHKFPYDKIEKSSKVYYTEISDCPVIFTRFDVVIKNYDNDTDDEGNFIKTWLKHYHIRLTAISLSETPLSKLIKGFAYETSDEAKKTADNLRFDESGLSYKIQDFSVNQYDQWPIDDPACILRSSANFQISEIFDPDKNTETDDEYRNRYLNVAKFFCLDLAGNKIELGFDDFTPKENK